MSDITLLICVGLLVFGAIISDWKIGIPISLFIGFLQDPIRKIIPEQPVVLNLLIVGTLLLTACSAMTKLKIFNLSEVFQNNSNLKKTLNFFVLFVFAQALNAFLRTNSPIVPILGIISYLLPLFSICLTYCFFRNIHDLEKLVLTYILINIVVACSIYLEWLNIIDWEILKPIGEALRITDSRVSGGILISHAGLMRTSEVAAWHMGSSICATFLLFLSGSYKKLNLMVLPFVMLLFSAGLLTGRRKFIATVITFLISYSILYVLAAMSISRKMSFQPLIILGICLLFGSIALNSILDTDAFDAYTTRGTISVDDVQDRFSGLGLSSIQWALDYDNWLGFGAGIVSGGSQYAAGESYSLVAGAGEGGLGKIIVELGLPGFFLCIVIVYVLTQYLWKILKVTHQYDQYDTKLGSLTNGILAFQIANFAVFTSASQIYGDPFVLSIQGFCMGFAFAAHKFLPPYQRAHMHKFDNNTL